MRVLVAMSGGVDSSVAAALLLEQGHDVVGVTLKLWGGESDTGCCSVSDVDDARRVADRLGIEHHTFGFADDFQQHVVDPYVAEHVAGRTPNPCIECNRHVKFDRLLRRADALGFQHLATGHHAQVVRTADGTWRLARGEDRTKDQSYVLSMLGQSALARLSFPVGDRSKADVRALAGELGLQTAAKPDSQEVCFIPAATGGRAEFLSRRVPLTPGRVVDGTSGEVVGAVPAVEAVTIGQRRGLALAGGAARRFVTEVDVATATVTVGPPERLLVDEVPLHRLAWSAAPVQGEVLAQTSAHGVVAAGRLVGEVLVWHEPRRRVAPGQTVAFYDLEAPDQVLGSGVVR